jgi:hypothetical protein
MNFSHSDPERRFREAWESVRIERPVHYSLFTFGESQLPYYLVCRAEKPRDPVSLTKGEVRITRPTIITPDSMRPEFQNFFEEGEGEGDGEEMIDFLLARSAAFSHLRLNNSASAQQRLSNEVEEVVARLNRELDAEEEDRVAILSAPRNLAGVAVLRYAAERVWSSAPDNVQELRERGFLP